MHAMGNPDDNIQQTFFLSLFNAYYGKIVAYVSFYLHDAYEAESIAQDVFIAVWDNIDIIKEPALPYLVTIAKRKSLNAIRKGKIRKEYQKYLTYDNITELSLKDSAIEQLLEKDVLDIITQTLDNLSPLTKETFLLNRIDNMTYKDIAKKKGITKKNVEYRILSTLRLIRKNINKLIK